jgi:hypothetical protein
MPKPAGEETITNGKSKCSLPKLSMEERNTNLSEKLIHDMYMISTQSTQTQYPFYNENTSRVNNETRPQTSKPQRKECCTRAAYMNALRSATVDPTATP